MMLSLLLGKLVRSLPDLCGQTTAVGLLGVIESFFRGYRRALFHIPQFLALIPLCQRLADKDGRVAGAAAFPLPLSQQSGSNEAVVV